MTDIADMAEQVESRERAAAVAYRKPEGPLPCGECRCCGAPVKDGRRFCDAACRDGWQREQDAILRNGGGMAW